MAAINLSKGDTALIIADCKSEGLLRNQAACVLGNVYHETAGTMKPVVEYGGTAYLKSKKYYPHYGRGHIQLTWEYNYKLVSEKLDHDFLTNPDDLLIPEYSAIIAVRGMAEGWFTGKKISDFVTLDHSDFFNARAVVNGDKNKRPKVKAGQPPAERIGDKIAGYCQTYDKLLKAAGYGEEPVVIPQPVPAPQPQKIDPVTAPETVLDKIIKIIHKLLGV